MVNQKENGSFIPKIKQNNVNLESTGKVTPKYRNYMHSRDLYIYWKIPPSPRGEISANVIWGENVKRKREKWENVREKGRERERKRENGK
jgi:hypothetical protein